MMGDKQISLPKRLWKALVWTPAMPRMNGLRTPPRHLPETTRDQMANEIRRARWRSNRFRLGVAFAAMVPVSVLAPMPIILRHVHTVTALPDAAVEYVISLAVIVTIELCTFRAIVHPVVVPQREPGVVAHHVCPRCDFDVRATPGRCPECGAVEVVDAR